MKGLICVVMALAVTLLVAPAIGQQQVDDGVMVIYNCRGGFCRPVVVEKDASVESTVTVQPRTVVRAAPRVRAYAPVRRWFWRPRSFCFGPGCR